MLNTVWRETCPMIRYAQLRPGRGFQLGRALAYYAQRLVTMRVARRCVSRCLSVGIRLQHGNTLPSSSKTVVDDAATALNDKGITRLADLFSPVEIEAMISYFKEQCVIGQDGHLVTVERLPHN